MGAKAQSLELLLKEIRGCQECKAHLPLGPNPVLAAEAKSKILIIGQAPGVRVHESGVPWDDPSGVRLRQWLGLSSERFYDTANVAIVPMGFCYPGTGPSGDMPPRPECAPLWHNTLIEKLVDVKLTLLIGAYAQRHVLGKMNRKTLTLTVKAWEEFLPTYLPLPHPSPRNNRWLKKNAWFEAELIPHLQSKVAKILR